MYIVKSKPSYTECKEKRCDGDIIIYNVHVHVRLTLAILVPLLFHAVSTIIIIKIIIFKAVYCEEQNNILHLLTNELPGNIHACIPFQTACPYNRAL